MLNYRKTRKNSRLFKTFTGFNKVAFVRLLIAFTKAYQADLEEREKKRKTSRERKHGGGRKGTLKHMEDKLVFMLFYFRFYPIQVVLAFLFGMSQAQANEWIHRLTPILNEALGYEQVLPARDEKAIEKVLKQCRDLKFIIDGTERPINRPKEGQRKYYSGKKKCHTVKNNIVTEQETGRVIVLSDTVEGSKSDKKLADEQELKFPPGSQLWQDKGYQGYAPHQPKKRPKKKELSEEEKATSRQISKERIGVEHSIGGVKIFRIVRDKYRNHKTNFEDMIMEIACGLFNLRLDVKVII